MKSERRLRPCHGVRGLLFVEPLASRGGPINPGDFGETGVPQGLEIGTGSDGTDSAS